MKLVCMLLAVTAALAGPHGTTPAPQEGLVLQAGNIPSAIFQDVETGIAQGDAGRFSYAFGRQVYLTLHGQEPGYVSASQLVYILDDFFRSHKTVQFKLTTRDAASQSPYATGGGTFAQRGVFERIQVYVGLTRQNDKWVISQLALY